MLATAMDRSPAIRGAPDRWEPSTWQAYTCAPALTRPSCWAWSELSPAPRPADYERLENGGPAQYTWAQIIHFGADRPHVPSSSRHRASPKGWYPLATSAPRKVLWAVVSSVRSVRACGNASRTNGARSGS